MRWPAGSGIAPEWRRRLLGGAVLGAIGYGAAVLLDFEPQPVPYVAMVVIVCTVAWLVLDTLDAPSAHWVPGVSPSSDRVDEATSDVRILSSHQQASVPSEALRERLVALARGRDPALAEALHAELGTVRRLSPAEIDRILTRIEDVRDRS